MSCLSTRAWLTVLCSAFLSVGANAQSGPVVIAEGDAVDALDSRIVITPGEGEWRPVSATAVVTIANPGSYVLGGNVIGVAGKSGIEISASNVTLDLNGYALTSAGVPSKHGVTANARVVNVRITNGALSGWKRGIDAGRMPGVLIDNVRANGCKGPGVFMKQGVVRDSSFKNNLNAGLQIGDGESTVENCASSENAGDGFTAGDGTVFKNCTAAKNLNGFNVGSGCVLDGCSATANTASGILVVWDAIITGCVSRDNAGAGIDAGNSCHIVDSTVSRNGLFGIAALLGSTVTNCTVTDHSGNGMYGIGAGSNVRLVGNHLSNNATGLFVTGNNCWIDGNSIASGGTGLLVNGVNNLITRNVVTGITVAGFNVAGGNDIATVRPSPNGGQPFDNIQY